MNLKKNKKKKQRLHAQILTKGIHDKKQITYL